MKIKTNIWQSIKTWITTHKKTSIVIGAVLLLAIASGATWLVLGNQKKPESPKITLKAKPPQPKPVTYYSPLTGVKVDSEAVTKQAVTAIMIENSPDARPQSGLKEAGIVYEAIAEGGITRFLTLHQESKPQLIGPVRSLRMYYVDWLAPYNASVAHIGGSAAALAEVRNGTYRDIDQFFNAAYYWRATDRYAPHNVYTSFEKLDALNQAKGYTTSTFTGFARADSKPASAPTATQISINFSGPLYNTTYTYNAATNTYARSLGGAPHMDREKGQITPSVVITINVDMVRVLEDGYRESIKTVGTGKATVFQNGIATEATWSKSDRLAPLTLTDAAGKPIELVRGQTWIAAVPNNTNGKVLWQ